MKERLMHHLMMVQLIEECREIDWSYSNLATVMLDLSRNFRVELLWAIVKWKIKQEKALVLKETERAEKLARLITLKK